MYTLIVFYKQERYMHGIHKKSSSKLIWGTRDKRRNKARQEELFTVKISIILTAINNTNNRTWSNVPSAKAKSISYLSPDSYKSDGDIYVEPASTAQAHNGGM